MRFFARIFQLFLKNDEYAIQKVQKMMYAKGLPIESDTIRMFMKIKREEVSSNLLANQYEDSFENNKKEKTKDQRVIEIEAKNKWIS